MTNDFDMAIFVPPDLPGTLLGEILPPVPPEGMRNSTAIELNHPFFHPGIDAKGCFRTYPLNGVLSIIRLKSDMKFNSQTVLSLT